ncbi:NAD-dependent deacetylase [Paraburkholderia sp. BR14263]|uniref:SIR2 family NAD-dependent protein deacylase n=1 Tax=unclassified Paraburkholderia TaxID=2615204 RepID=UPI0034CD76EC
MELHEKLETAARWLRESNAILITAGAGMGVDSGLPDFRGADGFWRAYPALQAEGMSFPDIANGSLFLTRPELAWGFYGHRLNLYRRVQPHAGFDILRRWGDGKEHGAFVFTSNVDGHFQKAGFAERRVLECHGTIHALQCARPCSEDVWPADEFHPVVDEARCLLISPIPKCPRCGGVARPNILMFDDDAWLDYRIRIRRMRLNAWLMANYPWIVVELGAGRAIPTVRDRSECDGPRIIRINTDDYAIDPGKGIGLPGRALDVLKALDERLMISR